MVTNVNTFVSDGPRYGSVAWARINDRIHSNVVKRSGSRLLTASGRKVKTVLHKGISFTFMIQLYIIAIVAAALAPLYSNK